MEDELIKKLELYVKNYDMNDENIKRTWSYKCKRYR